MQLFHSDKYALVSTQLEPSLSTPLGVLRLDVSLMGIPILWNQSRVYCHISRSCRIFQIETAECLVETLFVTNESQQLEPSTKPVNDSILIRYRIRSQTLEVSARIEWLPGFSWSRHYPESGEGLESKTWDNATWKVTVGTESAEYLSGRCRSATWMPRRMLHEIEAHADEIVQMDETSILLRLPPLEASEMCQLQFVVSTGDYLDGDISTWLAVDRSPDSILLAGDCE